MIYVRRYSAPREARKSWHAGWPAWIGPMWLRPRRLPVGVYARLGSRGVYVCAMPRRRRAVTR